MAKVTGGDKVRARFNRMANNRSLTDRALYAAGQAIEIEAEIGITRGSVSGKAHVASRPGDYPNADTHQLDTSIDTVVVGPNRVNVVSNAPYSAFLEFGTSRMEARPFMRPSVAAKKGDAIALIKRAVAQSTK